MFGFGDIGLKSAFTLKEFLYLVTGEWSWTEVCTKTRRWGSQTRIGPIIKPTVTPRIPAFWKQNQHRNAKNSKSWNFIGVGQFSAVLNKECWTSDPISPHEQNQLKRLAHRTSTCQLYIGGQRTKWRLNKNCEASHGSLKSFDTFNTSADWKTTWSHGATLLPSEDKQTCTTAGWSSKWVRDWWDWIMTKLPQKIPVLARSANKHPNAHGTTAHQTTSIINLQRACFEPKII